jgi:hypothetical protein
MTKMLTDLRRDVGAVTVEYAIGTVAAAAFGLLLLTIVRSGAVHDALSRIVQTALSVGT